MKRILLLVTNLTYGGAEAQVVRLAGELKACGWCATIASLVEPQTYLSETARLGVPVHTLRMKPGIPDLRAILRLRRLIRQFRPHVVHCHMFHANLLGRIARMISPIPVLICTVHNLRESSERGGPTWHKEMLYRVTDRLADATTIVCQAGFDRHVKVGAVPPHRLRVMPNFIDTDRYTPSSDRRHRSRAALGLGDEFVWLAVGRIVKQKDYPNLLRAVSALGPEKMKVLIAGGGNLAGELHATTRNLGLDGLVRFCGTREDILDLYSAADAYVMSSQYEGLSVALLEAASMALPAVVTDAGGNCEIVRNGESGFIVPCQDPAALAGAMRRMMSLSEDERLQMGQSAREHCRLHYDARVVTQQWLDFYEEARSGAVSRVAAKALSPLREAGPADRQAL